MSIFDFGLIFSINGALTELKLALPVTALVAVVVAAVVMWLVMVLVAHDGSRARGGLLHDTATRFMGLIAVATGVQFALTGFHDFFRAHPWPASR